MGDLITDFSLAEFACKCGKCGLPKSVHPALITGLQRLRDETAKPVTVNSGARCVEHNKAVGGAGKSEHIVTPEDPQAKAADIVIEGMTSEQAFALADKIPEFENAGIGVYDPETIIHVDVRDHKARWGRIKGKYVSLADFFGRPGITSGT